MINFFKWTHLLAFILFVFVYGGYIIALLGKFSAFSFSYSLTVKENHDPADAPDSPA